MRELMAKSNVISIYNLDDFFSCAGPVVEKQTCKTCTRRVSYSWGKWDGSEKCESRDNGCLSGIQSFSRSCLDELGSKVSISLCLGGKIGASKVNYF